MRPSTWRGAQKFAILSADEARAATGLEVPELLCLPNVQRLMRTLADGSAEEAFRVPIELAGDFAAP